MSNKHNIEIYTLGDCTPKALTEIFNKIPCCSCGIEIRDASSPDHMEKAKALKITAFPAVIVNGGLAENVTRAACCQGSCQCC
jgi:hypothetical protein